MWRHRPHPGTTRRTPAQPGQPQAGRVAAPAAPRDDPTSGTVCGRSPGSGPPQAGGGAGSPRDLSSAREPLAGPARRSAVGSLDLRGDPGVPPPHPEWARGPRAKPGVGWGHSGVSPQAERTQPRPAGRTGTGFASRGDTPEGHRPTRSPTRTGTPRAAQSTAPPGAEPARPAQHKPPTHTKPDPNRHAPRNTCHRPTRSPTRTGTARAAQSTAPPEPDPNRHSPRSRRAADGRGTPVAWGPPQPPEGPVCRARTYARST